MNVPSNISSSIKNFDLLEWNGCSFRLWQEWLCVVGGWMGKKAAFISTMDGICKKQIYLIVSMAIIYSTNTSAIYWVFTRCQPLCGNWGCCPVQWRMWIGWHSKSNSHTVGIVFIITTIFFWYIKSGLFTVPPNLQPSLHSKSCIEGFLPARHWTGTRVAVMRGTQTPGSSHMWDNPCGCVAVMPSVTGPPHQSLQSQCYRSERTSGRHAGRVY